MCARVIGEGHDPSEPRWIPRSSPGAPRPHRRVGARIADPRACSSRAAEPVPRPVDRCGGPDGPIDRDPMFDSPVTSAPSSTVLHTTGAPIPAVHIPRRPCTPLPCTAEGSLDPQPVDQGEGGLWFTDLGKSEFSPPVGDRVDNYTHVFPQHYPQMWRNHRSVLPQDPQVRESLWKTVRCGWSGQRRAPAPAGLPSARAVLSVGGAGGAAIIAASLGAPLPRGVPGPVRDAFLGAPPGAPAARGCRRLVTVARWPIPAAWTAWAGPLRTDRPCHMAGPVSA